MIVLEKCVLCFSEVGTRSSGGIEGSYNFRKSAKNNIWGILFYFFNFTRALVVPEIECGTSEVLGIKNLFHSTRLFPQPLGGDI